MKTFLGLKTFFQFAALALLTVPTSSFAEKFHCTGVRGTVGQGELFTGDRNVAFVGSFKVELFGPTEQYEADCSSAQSNEQVFRGFRYYATQMGGACPASTIRVGSTLQSKQESLISLVRTDGDRHDSSGYEYADFYCRLIR